MNDQDQKSGLISWKKATLSALLYAASTAVQAPQDVPKLTPAPTPTPEEEVDFSGLYAEIDKIPLVAELELQPEELIEPDESTSTDYHIDYHPDYSVTIQLRDIPNIETICTELETVKLQLVELTPTHPFFQQADIFITGELKSVDRRSDDENLEYEIRLVDIATTPFGQTTTIGMEDFRGGSWNDAKAIISSMEGSLGLVNTSGKGFLASAAVSIFVEGRHRETQSAGFLTHPAKLRLYEFNPLYPNDHTKKIDTGLVLSESSFVNGEHSLKTLLSNTNASIRQKLKDASRTGISEECVGQLVQEGYDVVFHDVDAARLGFNDFKLAADPSYGWVVANGIEEGKELGPDFYEHMKFSHSPVFW